MEDLEAILKMMETTTGQQDGAIADKYAERPVFGIRESPKGALLTLSGRIALLNNAFQQLRR
jgi:hypothetical protein